MRFTPVAVLLFVAPACPGADDATRATRKLDGDKTTFPAKSIAEGVRATIGAIESCHSTDWAGQKPPELAVLEKAQGKIGESLSQGRAAPLVGWPGR
jgi:hypothetical protein